MSTQIAFRADSITTSMPADDNFAGDNSSIIITRQPSVGAISDAINNVRFACTGFGGQGSTEIAVFTLNTRHTFRFRPRATGRLTAHTHFMPQGGFSLVGRAPTWFLDQPGFAFFNIFARMRVRILAANGTVPLNSITPLQSLFHFDVTGGSVAQTNEGGIGADVLEFSISRAFPTVVVLSDTVEVQARYTVQALASDGAEFSLDFASTAPSSGEPGDGLNSPFAVINISE
jgi:hypothetical protein